MAELVGIPVTYGIDPWSNEQYQQLPHGAIGYDRFGNKYRYVGNNGTNAMILGNLQSRAAIDTNFVDMAVQAAAPLITSGTAPFPNNKVAVTLGGTATTANQFAGGTAVVSVTPGIGQQFSIKSHDVQSTTNGTCNFFFNENLSVALTTSSKMTVLKNPYKDVIITPTTWTGEPIGVALNTIPASYFGWVGSHGVFGVRSDATGSQAIGKAMAPSTTTAGDVTLWVTTQHNIGCFLVAGVSTQVEPQWFNIN